MDEKIKILWWLCCRSEMMCECDGRENSWVKEPWLLPYNNGKSTTCNVTWIPWWALAELSYFYRQLCAKEIKKRYDGEVGEGDIGAYTQIRKNISSRVVQSDATSSCSYSIWR
jgi:hypothetical protein